VLCDTQRVAELAFDEETGRRLEAVYRIGDAVRRRRRAREALAALPGERILDVGCGPGFYCEELVEEVGPEGSVVGLDSSAEMLALAARRVGDRANVELRQAEATSLAVEDASFDGLLCVQVLEYVTDVAGALAQFHRALRPGGRAVVWDIDWGTLSWHSQDPARMARVLAAWDQHLVHRSLPRELAPALRRAGFEEVRMSPHTFATSEYDPETYGVSIASFIATFAGGRDEVSEDEAAEWLAEQRELGERGEFFFSCTQFCFCARRPD
jgi:SAM-dependent methyltransferase